MNRRYHYYRISVPTDAFETDEERGNCVINEARERARLYCIPAEWRARKLGSNNMETNFRVTRITNKPNVVIKRNGR